MSSRDEVVTFGKASTTHLNTTWDVIDLVAMVVEVCVLETGDSGGDWRLKLHIPLDLTEKGVE
eukprot:3322752-Prorocentrum_lima.AAC.1